MSFFGPTFDDAVIGILAGSLISGIIGAVILGTARAARRPSQEAPSP